MSKQEQMAQVRARYLRVAETLDERGRRAVAASEALTLGWGGVTTVSQATGLSRATIGLGIKELRGTVSSAAAGRVRRPGGGRKRTAAQDPGVVPALEQLVEPTTRGDPESPLRWTCKSVRKLAAELCRRGHQGREALVGGGIVAGVVSELLDRTGQLGTVGLGKDDF